MDVTPLVKQGQNIIQSYAGGQFKISAQTYEQAVIVRPDHIDLWDVSDFSSLTAHDFAVIASDLPQIDVILLGSGAKMQFLSRDLRDDLKEQGFTIDVMDTGAACRTYNMLMAEGRRVAAMLLAV